MRTSTIILVIFAVLLLGVLPTWPQSKNWDYVPNGSAGVAFLALIILVFTDRISVFTDRI